MNKPVLGERNICKQCGREIEYIGPYWRHLVGSFRHIAKPKHVQEVKDGMDRKSE